MKEKERKFKIKKIEKYTEDISSLKKEEIGFVTSMGIIALVIMCLAYGAYNYSELAERIASLVSLLIGNVSFVYVLRDLISTICERVMLQGKVEEIEMELELEAFLSDKDEIKSQCEQKVLSKGKINDH